MDHVEEFVGLGIDGLQVAVGREDLEPGGKEQVDLTGVFAKRGEAGGVPGDVERGTNAFLGVQDDLRGGFAGFAAVADAGEGGQAALLAGFFFLALCEGVVGTFFGWKERSGSGSLRRAL